MMLDDGPTSANGITPRLESEELLPPAFSSSDINAAIACYDEAIRINPNYAEAWYNKGLALKASRIRIRSLFGKHKKEIDQ